MFARILAAVLTLALLQVPGAYAQARPDFSARESVVPASLDSMHGKVVSRQTARQEVQASLDEATRYERLIPFGFNMDQSDLVVFRDGDLVVVSMPVFSARGVPGGGFSFIFRRGELVSSTQVILLPDSDTAGTGLLYQDGVLVFEKRVDGSTPSRAAVVVQSGDRVVANGIDDFWQCVLSHLPSYARDWAAAACGLACAVGGVVGCVACLGTMGVMYAIAAANCV